MGSRAEVFNDGDINLHANLITKTFVFHQARESRLQTRLPRGKPCARNESGEVEVHG